MARTDRQILGMRQIHAASKAIDMGERELINAILTQRIKKIYILTVIDKAKSLNMEPDDWIFTIPERERETLRKAGLHEENQEPINRALYPLLNNPTAPKK